MKEQQIIELLQAGKTERAFMKLYKIFPKVRSILKKYGADKDLIDDIFQDGLVALYQKLNQENFTITISIEAYLINTCKYIYLNKKKGTVPTKELTELVHEETDVEHFVEMDKKIRRAESVLQQMGEKCREILLSFYVHKKSMKEIAEQFSYSSENAAKTQKYKCLEAARNNYKQLDNIHNN
jgi:RNA polymerase sigma factor (sigma-70 family)